jgi:pimeloyl-ACP methyl ester carboxylesterase
VGVARLRKKLAIPLLIGVLLGCGFFTPPAQDHLHAAGALLRLENPDRADWIARSGTYPVDEVSSSINSLSARIYLPRGRASAPGLVIVPGVHHLGIDEPRLRAFARILASYGNVVLTPQLPALADYRIDESSIPLIGNAARELAKRLNVARVGVLGLSFAGGLALMAASRPEYRDYFSYVVAIGAHDDLGRVVRFFATDKAPEPDGSVLQMPAHPYGALVVVYDHMEDFFTEAEAPRAKQCLRLLLWEQPDAAQQCSRSLNAPAQAEMIRMIKDDRAALLPLILHEADARADEMARVSPHGRLAGLRAPVLLLHGAGDSVIPPSETMWLAQDVPAQWLRSELISPAISHVQLAASSGERLALVHWMAGLLAQAAASPQGRIPPSW